MQARPRRRSFGQVVRLFSGGCERWRWCPIVDLRVGDEDAGWIIVIRFSVAGLGEVLRALFQWQCRSSAVYEGEVTNGHWRC